MSSTSKLYPPYSYKRRMAGVGVCVNNHNDSEVINLCIIPIDANFNQVEKLFYSYIPCENPISRGLVRIHRIRFRQLQKVPYTKEQVIDWLDDWHNHLGGKSFLPIGWRYGSHIYQPLQSWLGSERMRRMFEPPERARCPLALAQSRNDIAWQSKKAVPHPLPSQASLMRYTNVRDGHRNAIFQADSAIQVYKALLGSRCL